MAANNSTSSISWCSSATSYPWVSEIAKYTTYFALMPIYVIVGLFSQAICLVAFRKQAKKDVGYCYQLYLAASKTIEVIAFAFFALTCKWWSDIDGSGSEWFMSSYSLTWIAAHVSIPLMNWCFTCSLFISIAQSADRVFALWKPIKYQQSKCRASRYIALALSIAIALLVNFFDCFRFRVIWANGRYMRAVDQGFVSWSIAVTFSNLKTFVRVSAVIALLILNAAILRLYRLKVIRTWVVQSTGNNDKEKHRRANEKTLTILTIVQSLVITAAILPLTSYYAVVFILPPFSTCPGPLVATIDDAVLQMAEMTNVGFLLITCKSFRGMANDVLRGCCRR